MKRLLLLIGLLLLTSVTSFAGGDGELDLEEFNAI